MINFNMAKHEFITANSSNLANIKNETVNLIVTSPPYPMVTMWDELFAALDTDIADDLKGADGLSAFNKMHGVLDTVWEECDRVLCSGGFVCVNIGDAARTIGGNFQLYTNHSRIISKFVSMGYSVLPDIHWRKQTNAPNKFMGSGMYPAGAYVTYEHEYILIFRKGGKRSFTGISKELRQKSAFFWEERNTWFSDLWEIKGVNQSLQLSNSKRNKNASFPFEIPYRLINMYSVEGDTVLDPFSGLGTTALACIASKRNSINAELDLQINQIAIDNAERNINQLNAVIDRRIKRHRDFILNLSADKKSQCYYNSYYDFAVKTRQETKLKIDKIKCIKRENHMITCSYM